MADLLAAAAALRALAAALEAPSARAETSAPKWYSRDRLPPGVRSWRAARERAMRESVATVRVGRDLLIDAAAWDASLRPGARLTLTDADAVAFAAMGLRLVGGGGRRG